MTERQYDIIVLGASGYTGQFVIEELGGIVEGTDLKFAIAGRNETKLRNSLKTASVITKLDLSAIDVIITDVNHFDSMVDMARKTKLVINCVGPYRYYGERVVKACIEAGANHIDISGEPQYLEQSQVTFDEAAREKGLYIVGSCGFDSVPADMGAIFLQDNFQGDVNSIEMIVGQQDSSVGNATINATTLECAIYGYANRNELKNIRKNIFVDAPPKSSYKSKQRGNLWWSDEAMRWCVPNMASDRSVVMRTQYMNYKLSKRRPAQFNAFFGMQSWWTGLGALAFGLIFAAMNAFSWTKSLFLRYPSFFSFGAFSHGGAKREDLEYLKFCITFIGRGWNSKTESLEEQHPDRPDVTKVVQVTGPDPGYKSTAIIVTQCALTILQEKDKLPQKGGVFTPGSAFLKTSLIDRLQVKGIKFEVK